MALYKLCSICKRKIPYEEHCECEDTIRKQRYKEYGKRRNKDTEQKKRQSFYNTKEWKRIRQIVIQECFGMDIVEYYRTGRVVQGYTVHHIQELGDCWDKRLDTDNLIYITESTHQWIHGEYSKGTKEKVAMQELLLQLKEKYRKEFLEG